MKHFRIFLFLCVPIALLWLCSSCSNNDEEAAPDDSEVRDMLPKAKCLDLSLKERTILQRCNTYSFQLLSSISDGKKSVMISPVGVNNMLGMLGAGCNADGWETIHLKMLKTKVAAYTFDCFCNKIITEAPNTDSQVKIEMANVLIVNKGMPVLSNYARTIGEYYNAAALSLDFSSPGLVDEINKWASTNTHGYINKVVDKVNPEDKALLLNSLYFDANWTKQFDKDKTTDELFNVADGSAYNMPMMHNTALVLGGSTNTFSYIEMDYGSGIWSMYILLPDMGHSVNEVLAYLKDKGVRDLKSNQRLMEMQLSIPKFSVSSTVDLKQAMQANDGEALFDANKPVLTKICDGDTPILLDNMYQCNHLDVNEEGTKLTAVTVSKGGDMYNPKDGKDKISRGIFNVNRPFVYLVTERTSGLALLVGTFTGN